MYTMTNATEVRLIDGRNISKELIREVKDMCVKLQAAGVKPKLCVVLVGARRDSATYVGMKEKACIECGIESEILRFEDTVTQAQIEACVNSLNADVSVDGILVQLPLPSHIEEQKVLDCIHPTKDVDGLHPMNVGCLALRDRAPLYKPCTAEGCVELCRRMGICMEGARVVVIGRSNIVGMPVALLFQQENATVVMCHSRTKNLPAECLRADIIIAAIGKPKFVKAEWVRDGAVVIDVGINAVDDATAARGYRLVGDVDFEDCKDKCHCITPVPGGVGPMTVAMLMKNTAEGCKRRRNL